MASALTASVPRRNPLSTITGIRPFTAAMISGSASIVERPVNRGAAIVLTAPAVIGNENSVNPVLHRQFRVLGSDDALKQDFHASDVAHSFDGIPGQIGGLAASGNASEIDAVLIVPAGSPRRKAAAIVTHRAFARIGTHEPEQGFLVSARDTVDRHYEDRTAGGLGSLDP